MSEAASTASRIETAAASSAPLAAFRDDGLLDEVVQPFVVESGGQLRGASSTLGTEGSSLLGAHVAQDLGNAVEVVQLSVAASNGQLCAASSTSSLAQAFGDAVEAGQPSVAESGGQLWAESSTSSYWDAPVAQALGNAVEVLQPSVVESTGQLLRASSTVGTEASSVLGAHTAQGLGNSVEALQPSVAESSGQLCVASSATSLPGACVQQAFGNAVEAVQASAAESSGQLCETSSTASLPGTSAAQALGNAVEVVQASVVESSGQICGVSSCSSLLGAHLAPAPDYSVETSEAPRHPAPGGAGGRPHAAASTVGTGTGGESSALGAEVERMLGGAAEAPRPPAPGGAGGRPLAAASTVGTGTGGESSALGAEVERMLGGAAEGSSRPPATASAVGTEGSSLPVAADVGRVLGGAEAGGMPLEVEEEEEERRGEASAPAVRAEVSSSLKAGGMPLEVEEEEEERRGEVSAPAARAEVSSSLKVAVKQVLGEVFEVALPRGGTVDDLKAAIQEISGVQPRQQVVGHRGLELKPGFATLVSLGVAEDPEVSLFLPALRKVVVRAWEGPRCKRHQDLYCAQGAHRSEDLELSVPANTTVGEVKRLIHHQWSHYSVADMSLHLNAYGISDGEWRAPIEPLALQDHCTLENLCVRSQGFLCLATGCAWKAPQAPLVVRIKPLSGAVRKVSVPPSSSVDDLKAAIQDAFGVPPSDQLLGHRGKPLADGSAALCALGFGADVEEVVALTEQPPLHRIVVRAWEGAGCAAAESSVPGGAHLQRELELLLPAAATVGEVKRAIRERWQHYRLADLSLHLNARGIGDPHWREPIEKLALADHCTLESLRLRTEGFLCVATALERRVRLQFTPSAAAAAPREIWVSAGCSVHELKQRIADLPGIPGYALKTEHVRLILSPGTPLEGGVAGSGTLADYNVQEGALILCLPVPGPCLGRPAPSCSALSGLYRCRCGSRDPGRLPALDRVLREHTATGAGRVPKPLDHFRLPPPQQLHGKTVQARKLRPCAGPG